MGENESSRDTIEARSVTIRALFIHSRVMYSALKIAFVIKISKSVDV